MITEDYVSFETAKLLREKGFNESCIYVYRHDGKEDIWDADKEDIACQKPTLQMAMKWLREVHKIFISTVFLEESDMYGFVIENISSKKYLATSKNDRYSTYEDACEVAIRYSLENLI